MQLPDPAKNCSPPAPPVPNRAKTVCASSRPNSRLVADSRSIPDNCSPPHSRPAPKAYAVADRGAVLGSTRSPSTPVDSDPSTARCRRKDHLLPSSDGKKSISSNRFQQFAPAKRESRRAPMQTKHIYCRSTEERSEETGSKSKVI